VSHNRGQRDLVGGVERLVRAAIVVRHGRYLAGRPRADDHDGTLHWDSGRGNRFGVLQRGGVDPDRAQASFGALEAGARRLRTKGTGSPEPMLRLCPFDIGRDD